ncbi:MAG: exosortase [Pseudomonadota bacterium]|jgi:exosortase
MATLASPKPFDWSALLVRQWFLVLGIAAVVLPTLYSLSQQSWSQDTGVHGPIVLATGLWLIARRMSEIPALIRPVRPVLVAIGLLLAVPAYVFGRAYDFISIEAAALLLAMVTVAYAYVGPVVIRMMWFPILYFCFMIPVPGWLLDVVTQPLKLFVSEVVTHGLVLAGYPIARLGVTIYVASYQLLVEDACAGLNSLVSLSAIGLFYVYMLRGSNWRYSILLLALVVPIAIAANCVRVAALVLLTYHAGDAVAQGYLHNFAGMVTFTSALLFIFLIDRLLSPLRDRLARKA